MTNLEKFLSILDEGECDGLLLTSSISRAYCAQFNIDEGVAILGKKGCRYFTDSRYIETAEKNLKGFQVQVVDRTFSYYARINAALEELGIERLGFEEDRLTVRAYSEYQDKLHATLLPCQKQLDRFRIVKEPWELERMVRAQEITDAAFSEVCPRIHAGMTEKELCAELIYCLYKNGAEGLSFPPIVVAGPNSSMPHGVPGDRRIQNGDFITMDFGVVWQGYCSDMTRTVALGFATDEMRAVYDTVLRAQLAGIAATRAGVSGCTIDGAARDIIAQAGYGNCFGHGYGHCLGLEIHESPNCNPSNDQPMPAGSVSSAEPGIYLPGKFGVRIEDVVVLETNGCRNLTHSPKELLVL